MTKGKSSRVEDFFSTRNDFVSKLFMGDKFRLDYLADFLKSVLTLPAEEFDRLTIVDPRVNGECGEDKDGVLGVTVLTKSKKTIHVEFQMDPVPNAWRRILCDASKLYMDQLTPELNFAELRQTISIVITDFDLVKGSDNFHHHFEFRNREAGIVLPDSPEIHILELCKLPKTSGGAQK